MSDWNDISPLVPLTVEWLLGVEATILAEGRELTLVEIEDARAVGVQAPEQIRLLFVDVVAQPEHPVLLAAGRETGLLGEQANARTIGYGIEIVNGAYDRALLRHECRHVYQFERAGSRQEFISDYIKSVLTDGYTDSIFEIDARAFEAY